MAKIEKEDVTVERTANEIAMQAQIDELKKLINGTADSNKLANYENKNKRKPKPMARVWFLETEIGGERQYIKSTRIKKDQARSSLDNFTDANSQVYEITFVNDTKTRQLNINDFTFNLKKTDPIESVSITTNDEGVKFITLPIEGVNVEFDSRFLN